MSSFTLDQVVPWGRSFDEYRRMFRLGDDDLRRTILGCGDGPASFNYEMMQQGHRVISVDPLYAFSQAQITQRIDETYDKIIDQMAPNLDEYIWAEFKDPDGLGRHRRWAMSMFLADYPTGLAEGRYLAQALPKLNFDNDTFDLALCSHFLFLYSEQFSYDFHYVALQELCRVAREVRIFPLLALNCRQSPHVSKVQADFATLGLAAEIIEVNYEFQKGGNRMMRIFQQS